MKRPKFKIQMTDLELDRYSVAQDKYVDHLETVVKQLVEDDEHHVRQIDLLRAMNSELGARIVILQSNILDGDHTGDYRTIPRRGDDDET